MFTLRLDVKQFARDLQTKVSQLENAPSRNHHAFWATMTQGVLRNFESLSMGGSVPAVSEGGDIEIIKWDTTRSPQTKRERRLMADKWGSGIGPIYPMLSTRGGPEGSRFYKSMLNGIYTASLGRASLRPADAEMAKNIAEHHYGTISIINFRLQKKYGLVGQLPARPFIFWSQDMKEGILNIIKQSWT